MSLKFFLPFEIDMAKSSDGEENRYIRGYASTPALDRQNEEVLQKGLDISEFLEHGWFNYDHDNSKIIGYPNKQNTRVDGKGLYVEGSILKGVRLADEVWELAKALRASNSPRKLGFSIEGKVLSKNKEGKILKAKIYNVAITPSPVNTDATWEILAKSFGNDSTPLVKAEAGYETNIGDTNNGGVLKAESLESAFSILSQVIGGEGEAKSKFIQLRELLLSKSLTEKESILYLQLYKGLSKNQAIKIIKETKKL